MIVYKQNSTKIKIFLFILLGFECINKHNAIEPVPLNEKTENLAENLTNCKTHNECRDLFKKIIFLSKSHLANVISRSKFINGKKFSSKQNFFGSNWG